MRCMLSQLPSAWPLPQTSRARACRPDRLAVTSGSYTLKPRRHRQQQTLIHRHPAVPQPSRCLRLQSIASLAGAAASPQSNNDECSKPTSSSSASTPKSSAASTPKQPATAAAQPAAAAVATPPKPVDLGAGTAAASSTHGLKPFHLFTFFVLLATGLIFLAVLLYFTADIQFQRACIKVVKRLLKTVALRQVFGILAAMTFVRFGLEPLVKLVRQLFSAAGPWEKSSEFYILREVYRPLEFLFSVAAFTTLVENFLPQLIALPKGLVQGFVRSTLSLTFVIAAARVVFSIKARMTRETIWQLELKGDLTKQRRVEAVDKLTSVLTLLVSAVFGLQAIGLDVNSVLAIGGVGGLAVGLAGREILENLFTGLIILSSSPFEVGDEVLFTPASGGPVEGIVLDVGWYRTTIRSFEREIYNIPNSVFSRNVVLNITRKSKEWRFYERIGLRVKDVSKVGAVVADMRKIIRQDPRIIQKLHRRVFLDKIAREQIDIYISCYVDSVNRDAFMAVKQDLLLAFVDCVERNGGKLARNRLQLEVMPTQLRPPPTPPPKPAAAATSEPAENPTTSTKALPSAATPQPGSSSGRPPTPDLTPQQPGVQANNITPRPSSSSSSGAPAGAGSDRDRGDARSQSGGSASGPERRREAVAAVAGGGSDGTPMSSVGQLGSLVSASFDDLPQS